MKIVLQRVMNASVSVSGRTTSSISAGFVLLVGVERYDTEEESSYCAKKISRMRVFEDEAGKMNRDIRETGGAVLSVPQFTLAGSVSKGNRPGFEDAAEPEKAKELWKEFNDRLRDEGIPVNEGEFGAHMVVSLDNDGPVTFIVEKRRVT